MVYNNVDIDDSPTIEKYTEIPSWYEVFEAKATNMKAASLSTSENNYYNDELEKNVAQWENEKPEHKATYDQLRNASYQNLDRLEEYYQKGNIDKIKSFYATPGEESHLGNAFLQYKTLGFKDIQDIRQDARDMSLNDLRDSQEVLERSDSTSAEIMGGLWGLAHDPVIVGTLPLGTWKTGATVLGTAAKAALEEMKIEALVQTATAPQVYSYKKELGLKTSIKDEAYNAVAAIGLTGALRGTASATFDLSEKGIKALRTKDPELADDYQRMENTRVAESMDDHIDNLDSVEFGNGTIKNLDEKGLEVQSRPNVPEVDEETIVKAQTIREPREEELSVFSGTNEKGEAQYQTYADMETEIDINEKFLNDVLARHKAEKEINTGSVEYGKQIEAEEAEFAPKQGFQPKVMTVGTQEIRKTDFDLIQKYEKNREFNRKNPDKKRDIPQKQKDAYKKHENIADDLKDMEFQEGASMPIFGLAAAVTAAGIATENKEEN